MRNVLEVQEFDIADMSVCLSPSTYLHISSPKLPDDNEVCY
jgi:hypothetical protein